jgi:energy-coupling factor transporter ATP-binding protein EcfA2
MDSNSVNILNCNSIKQARIEVVNNCLNIKYGANGVGKSTIARALAAAIDPKREPKLESFLPFQHRSASGGGLDLDRSPNPLNNSPKVSGYESFKSVLIYDEAYVGQFVFQKDELIKNSFEVFIKSSEYIKASEEIESLLTGVKSEFARNESLAQALNDLTALRDAFNLTKSGDLAKTSSGLKALENGNKLQHIPQALEDFRPFLQSEKPATWISWQSKGNAYAEITDRCPYCASNIAAPEIKERAKNVSKEYDSKTVEHLCNLQVVIERLGKYFPNDCLDRLHSITRAAVALTTEAKNFLTGLRGDVDTLATKLSRLQSISFVLLDNVSKIDAEIEDRKINLSLLERLNSSETAAIVQPLNNRLDELKTKVDELKTKIGTQQSRIKKSIREHSTAINEFLTNAGYAYTVSFDGEGESYRMRLRHQDFPDVIEAGTQHLSYGEKNAFALILFMYQALHEKPDLVVLDDPVSSFDKTKKYAILSELFTGKGTLRDFTVLMLTHDLEPIIDVFRSVNSQFQQPQPRAHFLRAANGEVIERLIEGKNIQPFTEICDEVISEFPPPIVACTYLRRKFQVVGGRDDAYQYLSNLLHGRNKPVKRLNGVEQEMTADEVAHAEEQIRDSFPTFDYDTILKGISDAQAIKDLYSAAICGYDKLQLFRIYQQKHGQHLQPLPSALTKFINESFHIENDFIMQLNPRSFDAVPNYVVAECDRLIEGGDTISSR